MNDGGEERSVDDRMAEYERERGGTIRDEMQALRDGLARGSGRRIKDVFTEDRMLALDLALEKSERRMQHGVQCEVSSNQRDWCEVCRIKWKLRAWQRFFGGISVMVGQHRGS